MERILKEPLLHFLLLGAAIFAAYGLVSNRSRDEPGKIVITQGVTAMATASPHLARPPTSGNSRDDPRPCPGISYCREAWRLG